MGANPAQERCGEGIVSGYQIETPTSIHVLLLTLSKIYVAVNFLFQLIFVFPLFLGMVMYANEFETKEKQN